MGTKMSQLVEATTIDNTDIMHLRTTGGIDKKITFANVLSARLIGYQAVQLTEVDTVNVPQIAAGGVCEINGVLLSNGGNLSISGTTANNNWYEILLTPSGTTYTASFIAHGS